MPEYLLGLDLGTSGCKALLVSTDGLRFFEASRKYDTIVRGRIREQRPKDWINSAREAIREVLKLSHINPRDIIAVGVTGQFPSIVPLHKGKPAGNAILYSDWRVDAEKVLSKSEVLLVEKVTELPRQILSTLPSIKLAYLRKKGLRFDSFLSAKDFLRYFLTGEKNTDWLEAWWTGLASKDGVWIDDMLELLGLDDIERPRIGKFEDIGGEVSREASRLTGLPPGTPVAVGTIDGMSAIIGGGLEREGDLVISSGSTDIIAMISSRHAQRFLPPSFYTWRYVLDNLYVIYTSTASSGASVEFFLKVFNLGNLSSLTNKAAKAPAGALVFMPYLQGEFSPFFDLEVKGAILGLSLETKPENVFRSILEGVAFSDRHVIHAMERLGGKITRIRLGGGGSRNDLWNTIRASILKREIEVLEIPSLSALGAAIFAGMATRTFRSYLSAFRVLVKVKKVVEIDHSLTNIYDKVFKEYLALSKFIRKKTRRN